MNKGLLLSAMLAGTALVAVAPAQAAPRDHVNRAHFHHIISHPHARFVLRHDFRHFSPAEHRWWGGGHWRHTRWHGRYGWWWNVGPSWYFYDSPVYPYPTEVSPTYYDDENYDDDDQGGYDDQGGSDDQGGYDDQGSGQQDMGPGYGGGGSGVWYHCSSPEGYYPYVKNCRNWEQVPASPNGMQGSGASGPPRDMGPNGGPPPDYNDDDQGPPPNGR